MTTARFQRYIGKAKQKTLDYQALFDGGVSKNLPFDPGRISPR